MIDYIISDTHFNHENIIDLCNRPFDSVEEMDDTLKENWNTTVDPSDTVLFLGDLLIGSKSKQRNLLSELNGEIVFVKGNHDDLTMQSNAGLIYEGLEFSIKGIAFYANHYPLPELQHSPKRILHGHTHNNNLSDHPFYNHHTGAFNFSAELVGYTPVSIDDVISIIRSNTQSLHTLNDWDRNS